MKIDKVKIRYHVLKFGYVLSFAFTMVIIYTFMIAYFSPTKTIVVDVNWVGEAHLEFLLILIFIPLIAFAMWETKTKFLPKILRGEL